MMWDDNHEVQVFYAVTMIIAAIGYLPWVLSSYDIIPENPLFITIMITLGGLSPTIGAIFTARRYYGIKSKFLFGAFSRRFHPVWIVVALAVPLLIFIGAIGLAMATGEVYDLTQIEWLTIIPLVVSSIFLNVWEEIGWRGFALPKLQEKYSALISSIIIGLMGSLWHWPHFLVNNSQMLQNYGSFAIFVLDTTLGYIIITWLYNSARGNLVIPTLFHAMINAAGIAIVVSPGLEISEMFQLVVLALIALLILAVLGANNLATKHKITISDLIEGEQVQNQRLE